MLLPSRGGHACPVFLLHLGTGTRAVFIRSSRTAGPQPRDVLRLARPPRPPPAGIVVRERVGARSESRLSLPPGAGGAGRPSGTAAGSPCPARTGSPPARAGPAG